MPLACIIPVRKCHAKSDVPAQVPRGGMQNESDQGNQQFGTHPPASPYSVPPLSTVEVTLTDTSDTQGTVWAATLCRVRISRRRRVPRMRWGGPSAPCASKRRRSRRTCRSLTCKTSATSRLLIRPATKALNSPTRGASFRLIVRVSRGFMGGHFHGPVTGGHFHRPTACLEAPV